ncbi:DoxX-like family protein [Polynucleobacter meluiroseus]|uniref:DoxX-like family protein n=1 Tax=Polynucleobacter meluiroseus TaxID=1938814 RepID=A0A240DYF8_9BURK|nr:DoxX family protein [Polynucleobacter meluiroseus]SNX28053.1 DoxX-like family protein [Polynucleobacter meluiroseus]
MNFIKRNWAWILTIYVAFVFIQSLFFKFTGSPETVYIFQGKLDPWAASLGFPGVFAPGGIFSAKVVGIFELIASALLIVGAFMRKQNPWIQIVGAAVGLGVISGAIFFHLFTPLGIAVVNTDGSSDSGQLFSLACGVWIACAWLLFLNKVVLQGALKKFT